MTKKPRKPKYRLAESLPTSPEKWATTALILKEGGLEGKIFEVVIIEAGLSKNDRIYSAEVLAASAPLFEGVNVYVHQFGNGISNHLPPEVRAEYPDGVAGNFIGHITDVRMGEASGKPALLGNLHVADERMRGIFKNLCAEGCMDRLGFSIDVEGLVSPGEHAGRPVKTVESIAKVYAVDVVTYPAAGGRLARVLASDTGSPEENPMKKKLVSLLSKFSAVTESFAESLTEAQLAALVVGLIQKRVEEAHITGPAEALALLKEAMGLIKGGKTQEAMTLLSEGAKSLEALMSGAPAAPAPSPAPARAPEAASFDGDVAKKFAEIEANQKRHAAALVDSQVRESQANIKAKLVESKIPQIAKDKLARELSGQVLSESEIDSRLAQETDFLAKLSESGDIKGLGNGAEVTSGRSKEDKVAAAVDLMVGYEPSSEEKKAYAGVRAFGGLREAYQEITGDRRVSWNRHELLKEANGARMVEAVSTDFPKVLGDSITRRLLQMYRSYPKNWDKLANIVPVNDFRTQRRIQWGHFADLAVVAEDAAFTSLANPAEKEATYSAQKRGKKFAITREMILADDLRKLRQIPGMMSRAAHRTLEKFVFNLLIGNVGAGGINTDLIYDGAVLYTVAKANLGTGALDASTLRAARIRMQKQKDESSNETLGLRAAYLWVPLDLGPTAEVLVGSELLPGSANNDINDNFKSVMPIAVPYLSTDTNNWYLSAAKTELEGIEIGFVSGQEEPEVLVQDDPTNGDVFTNERITYKVRHEYGGAILDYRAFDGSIVP